MRVHFIGNYNKRRRFFISLALKEHDLTFDDDFNPEADFTIQESYTFSFPKSESYGDYTLSFSDNNENNIMDFLREYSDLGSDAKHDARVGVVCCSVDVYDKNGSRIFSDSLDVDPIVLLDIPFSPEVEFDSIVFLPSMNRCYCTLDKKEYMDKHPLIKLIQDFKSKIL